MSIESSTDLETLETLPLEIITLIADHLRASTTDIHDFSSRIPRLFPCQPSSPARQLEALLESKGHYQDAGLAFGMASRR